MTKWIVPISLIVLGSSTQAFAQSYPIADKAAAAIVQKYNSSSCDVLAQARQAAPDPQKEAMRAKVGAALRQDAGMRTHFVNQVAPTIVNKMVECGFIP